ncbi:MAG: hypothetical protein ACI81V_000793 [Lentimonas sp.]|jgi:hypothetical protein
MESFRNLCTQPLAVLVFLTEVGEQFHNWNVEE